MKIDSDWKSRSVGEFVDRANWLGIPLKICSEVKSLVEFTKQLEESLILWKSLPAKDFFSLNNWDGKAMEIFSTIQSREDLSFTFANDRFWQCFAWRGVETNNSTSIISLEPNSSQVPSEAGEFTLENFSQLF